MGEIVQDYIVNYIRNLIIDEDNILKEIESFATKEHIPIVQKEVASFLKFMITIHKPKKILELGTAIGYSAIVMNLASIGNADITTIEREKDMIDIAENNITKYGFKEKIKIIEGDCLDILPTLNDQYDMIFIDAGKGHYNEFLPYCLKLLNKEGIIIADNVLFRGMVACDDLVKRRKITIVKRMRKFLNLVCNNKDLITTVIPIGDGILVTTRRNTND